MALSLRRNILWTFAGNSIFAACQWAIVVLLAQLAGPEAVGRYALALAIGAPVMLLCNLSLRQVQVTDAHSTYPFADYLSVRLITSLLGVLAITLVALFGYGGETAAVIIAIGVTKGFESMSDIFYGVQQRHERMDRVSRSIVMRGVLGITALGAGYWLGGSLLSGVIAMAASWAAVLWLYDLPASRRYWKTEPAGGQAPERKAGDSERPRASERPSVSERSGVSARAASERVLPEPAAPRLELVKLALPLGIAAMLVSLVTNIPRYFIEHYLGEEQLGVFAAMTYLIIAGGMVINAVGQAASPRLANYFAANDLAAFSGLLGRMALMGFAVGGGGLLAAIVVGEPLLRLLYGEAFAQNIDAFVWVMVGGLLTYVTSCLGYGMTAMRLFRIQPVLFTFIGLVSVVACYLLIPAHGLLGAVWAFDISLLAQLLLTLAINAWSIHQARTGGEVGLAPSA